MDACSDISETFSMDHSVSSPDTTRIDVTQPLNVDCSDDDPDDVTLRSMTTPNIHRQASRRDRKKSKMSPSARESLRLKINHRERERMHDLNSSMDALRQVMPYAHGPSVKKLSKMATLLLARNYIILLTRSMEEMRRLLAEAYRNPLAAPPGGLAAHHLPGAPGFRPGLEKLLTMGPGLLPPLGPLPSSPTSAVHGGPIPGFNMDHLTAHRLPPRSAPEVPSPAAPPVPSAPTSLPSHVVHHPTPKVAAAAPPPPPPLSSTVSSSTSVTPGSGMPAISSSGLSRVDVPSLTSTHQHLHPHLHHPNPHHFPPPPPPHHLPPHHPFPHHLTAPWSGAPCSCVYCHLAVKSSESLLKQA